MPTSRRLLLSTALAGTSLLVAGRDVRAASDTTARNVAQAVAPWAAARTEASADWRLAALRWAVLAPNPHNRQPWLAKLVGDDMLELRCDLDRRLPETDPFDRQITIGLGAFAELFRLAAAAQGIAVQVEAFPNGAPATGARLDGRPVARLARIRSASASPDPLFPHAGDRRSAKRPFDTSRALPPATAAAMAQAAGGTMAFVTDAESVARLKQLAWDAWLVELRTERTHLETVNLMRLGSAENAASPDGVAVMGPGIDEAVAAGQITRASFAAPDRPGYGMMVARYEPMLAATNAYVWTAGPDTRAGQLAAGAQWLRLNLAATGAGVALHPISQALQEYPEMAPHFAALHAMVGTVAPDRLHMLGRIGFLPQGAAAPATPRWAAESRILS